MSRPTLTRPVADVLRTITSLRTFCLALPHSPTPAEIRQLERFERLRRGGVPLRDDDIETLRAGLRHCWRRRDAATLQEIAVRIPAQVLEQDRWLQSFVVAAQALPAAPGRNKRGHRALSRRLTGSWPVED